MEFLFDRFDFFPLIPLRAIWMFLQSCTEQNKQNIIAIIIELCQQKKTTDTMNIKKSQKALREPIEVCLLVNKFPFDQFVSHIKQKRAEKLNFVVCQSISDQRYYRTWDIVQTNRKPKLLLNNHYCVQTRHIYILFTSSNSRESQKFVLLKGLFKRIVSKPFSPVKLIENHKKNISLSQK